MLALFQKYKSKIIEYSIVVVIVGLLLAYFNSIKNKEIVRLKAINSIESTSHKKEIEVLKEYNKKEIDAIKIVKKQYALQVERLNREYSIQLKKLSEQQKLLYKKYLENNDLIIKDIEKLFNIKVGK